MTKCDADRRQATSLRRVDTDRADTQLVPPAGHMIVDRASTTFEVRDLP